MRVRGRAGAERGARRRTRHPCLPAPLPLVCYRKMDCLHARARLHSARLPHASRAPHASLHTMRLEIIIDASFRALAWENASPFRARGIRNSKRTVGEARRALDHSQR